MRFIPTLAVTVRRLHDIGKSGGWYFIIFVPMAGGIILLVFTCLGSVPGSSQYGEKPKNRNITALYYINKGRKSKGISLTFFFSTYEIPTLVKLPYFQY